MGVDCVGAVAGLLHTPGEGVAVNWNFVTSAWAVLSSLFSALSPDYRTKEEVPPTSSESPAEASASSGTACKGQTARAPPRAWDTAVLQSPAGLPPQRAGERGRHTGRFPSSASATTFPCFSTSLPDHSMHGRHSCSNRS